MKREFWLFGGDFIADLKTLTEQIVQEQVRKSPNAGLFLDPIVGFADAGDPLYDKLDAIIGHPQLHPNEFLKTAKTVIVYFIPFSADTVKTIQGNQTVSKNWSQSYTAANQILYSIANTLEEELKKEGVIVKSEPPTYTNATYDSINLTSRWSHKSSAVIAGIGTFGLNHLLITEKGTAGRLGSVVIDAIIPPTKKKESSHCLYYKAGKCKVCVEKCPTGALSIDGSFQRFRCNAYLDGKNIHELEQGCGMCSSGPCAMKGF